MSDKNMFDEYIKKNNRSEDQENDNQKSNDKQHKDPASDINEKESETLTYDKNKQLDHDEEMEKVKFDPGETKTKPSSYFPESFLPWDNSENANTYTKKLIDNGYTSIKMIASSTKHEILHLTGIPETMIEKLLERANSWHSFAFETAASLLHDRGEFKKISTGCQSLNSLLGGGVEPRSITEFYGKFTTGKTQLCMQLAVNAALPEELGGQNGEVVYIDTEGSFRPERAVQMIKAVGGNPKKILDRILIGRAHNTNVQMQLTNNVVQEASKRDIILVIIDSITSNFRAEFTGKGALLERQQKLNQHIQQLSKIADMLNIAVVITNQVISAMDGFENNVIAVGGNILAHGTTHRIQFTKSTKRRRVRYAELVSSPSLAEKKVAFKITEHGIRDVNYDET